jgi:hypothetical protein
VSTSAGARAAHHEREIADALARLASDGFVERTEHTWKTGRRFQRAMARAAARLYADGDPGDDLRMPITLALIDLYGDAIDDDALAAFIEAMLPIEATSLGITSPSFNVGPVPQSLSGDFQ